MIVGWKLCSRLWAWNGLPLNTYTSMYTRTNRCYNGRGSRTNYVRSSIPHCVYIYIFFFFILTLRRLMSYIYGAPILDVSRSHTTTQHSR